MIILFFNINFENVEFGFVKEGFIKCEKFTHGERLVLRRTDFNITCQFVLIDRSPKLSPKFKVSPKQRATKRRSGGAED